MYINKSSINCFYGVWDIATIPMWISIPLTIFACVGIINAINLIDGVNGLSSGFCFMSSILFAIMFYNLGNKEMMIIAISAAGAIIPFFLHNVFGNKTKMFIGDSGTLAIGTMISMFVISILKEDFAGTVLMVKGVGLIPFLLAVLSIPVFDTLRVMSTRILNGKSPFSPDKTHLHHMFIDLGFSHTATTTSILSLNFIITATWFLSYKLGASIDMQLYIVLTLSILFTFGLYNYSQAQLKKDSKALHILQRIGKSINLEKKGIWEVIQRSIDKL
jgi:UDP-N-acetylmuramyl pentapeptide phosphotransferase/UDP-N-acetylglucosamine-1-phosphate transferase